jgi:hypothetical protein
MPGTCRREKNAPAAPEENLSPKENYHLPA